MDRMEFAIWAVVAVGIVIMFIWAISQGEKEIESLNGSLNGLLEAHVDHLQNEHGIKAMELDKFLRDYVDLDADPVEDEDDNGVVPRNLKTLQDEYMSHLEEYHGVVFHVKDEEFDEKENEG